MYNNLIEILTSKKDVWDRGVIFIRSQEEEEFLPYGELYRLAKSQKESMTKSGVAQGTEVVLQYEDSKMFMVAFWACILGNRIPVPQAVQRGCESIQHVLKVYQNLKHPCIATTSARRKEIMQYAQEHKIQGLHFCEPLDKASEGEAIEEIISCNPEETAFLQFSSGSTGEPKGVKISHKNLIENFKGMIKSSEIVETDSMLSWMPLYHNLGLIVSHMLGIVCNLNSYIMSTELFIYQPYLWMEKISEHRVTLTCSPNFGYRYYLRGMVKRDCTNLDLSCLRIILTAAEPISLKTCNTFLEMMKNYHLKENVFQSGYGLAEATVSVASTYVGKSLVNVWISGENHGIGKKVQFLDSEKDSTFAIELVKVGRPHYNNTIRIVDEKGVPLEEGFFGEIQVGGPIVSNGYYEGLSQNEKMKVTDGWLSTGDIGFIHNGELVISGRKKDIIFINGKNYYCHDLEGVIREAYPNCECAICSSYSKAEDRDRIILFLVKGDRTYKELRSLGDILKKRVVKHTGVLLDKVVVIDEIPRTGSAKIQRFQLQDRMEKGLYTDLDQKYTRTQVIDIMQEQLKKILGFQMEDLDESIVEAGLNSIKAAQFHKLMGQIFDVELPVSIVYDYPSVNKIADFIMGEKEVEEVNQDRNESFAGVEIAVIGMACQFPNGADTLEEYWRKLLEEYDGITAIPKERERLREYCESNDIEVKGGFLSDIAQFDAGLFGISPKEAQYLDPQQRMLLKNSYLALLDACLDIKKLRGSRTGVYVGISNSDYKDIMPKDDTVSYMLSGNMNNMAAGRISYTFDFHGPSLVVDTACSSSLVTIHQAVLSLRSGETDMALAGGVNCILSPYGYLGLREMKALSPTYHCHTFDEQADGYVRSEGCGVVVLKRYKDALQDGDRIYAVIKGSAVNSDGWSSGLTAPNGTAQVRVMRQALKNAGVMASQVSFVETHGTGTKLGDPQEINALNLVYGEREKALILGAGKTNIGHTECAAGIAAFIKTVLALYKGVIPGNRGVENLNHLIPWDSMKFQVPTKSLLWEEPYRMAGISAFGLSGTNAHMIVAQEKKNAMYAFPKNMPQILTLSARKKELLIKDIEALEEFLEKQDVPLEHILYTLNRCRAGEKYKIAVAARNTKEYITKLRERRLQYLDQKTEEKGNQKTENKKVILMFSGMSQLEESEFWTLYEENTIFQSAVKECEEILQMQLGVDIGSMRDNGECRTSIQKLYFSMMAEYGVVKCLEYFGVLFGAVMAHENGEWIGAVVAGILTLRQAFLFATAMEKVREGFGSRKQVALLFISEQQYKQIQKDDPYEEIYLRTVNTKDSIVVSYKDYDTFLLYVKKHNILYMELAGIACVGVKEKEKAVNAFGQLVSKEEVREEKIPYFSTSITREERMHKIASGAFSWMLEEKTNILHTMRALDNLGMDVYLECNVRPYMSALVEQNVENERIIIPAIRKSSDEETQLRGSIGKLYELGMNLDFSMDQEQGTWLTKLPVPQWKQSRYWFKE